MDEKIVEAVARALEPRCFARMDEGWPRSHMNAFEARTEASDRRRIARARKNAATAIEAYESAKAAQQWQPIETAPKDGTSILVCWGRDANGKPIDWTKNPKTAQVFVQVAAWWSDEGERGEWIVYCSQIEESPLHFDPTHWMPLPAPPSAAQQGGMPPQDETRRNRLCPPPSPWSAAGIDRGAYQCQLPTTPPEKPEMLTIKEVETKGRRGL